MGIFTNILTGIGENIARNPKKYIAAGAVAGPIAIDQATGGDPEAATAAAKPPPTVGSRAGETFSSWARGIGKAQEGISGTSGFVIPKLVHPTQDPETTKRNWEQRLANVQDNINTVLPAGARKWAETPVHLEAPAAPVQTPGSPPPPPEGVWASRLHAAEASGRDVINNMNLSQGAVAEGGTAMALSTLLAIAARKKLPRTLPMVKPVWKNITPSTGRFSELEHTMGPVALAGASTTLGLMPGTMRPVEKNRQDYEGDKKAVEDARAKWQLEDTANKRMYNYKPAVASAVGGLVGGTVGYYMTDDNKFLWSTIGTLLGGAAPYAIKTIADKRNAMAKTAADQAVPAPATAAPAAEAPTVKEVVGERLQQDVGAIPKIRQALGKVDWKTLWDQHKYDIGAGAAAGLGVAGGIKAYNDPESRWWSIPGSTGLLGSAYWLAQKGNDERRIRHTPMTQLKHKDFYGTHERLGAVMPMVTQLESEMRTDTPRAGDTKGLTKDQVNNMLWKLEEIGKQADTEHRPKEQRMKRAVDVISGTMEQSPVFSDKDPASVNVRRQYADALNQMLEAGESGDPITSGTQMLTTARSFAANSDPNTAGGPSPAVSKLQLMNKYRDEAVKLYGNDENDDKAIKARHDYIQSKMNVPKQGGLQ